jgi:hypothetical protein
LIEQLYENQEINNQSKTPAEIREKIQAALSTNEILGYLNNNILYMKSFGRNSTPDKIFAGIGAIIAWIGLPDEHYRGSLTLILIGGTMLAIGSLVSWLVKHYLVYDTDREVFYTITNLFNKTIFRSKEVARKDIVELGVDVTDRNESNQIYNEVLHPKKDQELIDNPGLKTSFVALITNGKKINISDPIALRKPHEVAVARCQLFSDCFNVKSVICNKNEALKIGKNENNNYTFKKYSKESEWESARKTENSVSWIILITLLICLGVVAIFCLY